MLSVQPLKFKLFCQKNQTQTVDGAYASPWKVNQNRIIRITEIVELMKFLI
jgi:hypothetical protein